MSVFTELAEAKNRLRRAKVDLTHTRARFEQQLVKEADGVKNLGPNIVDQERVFAVRAQESLPVMRCLVEVGELEDAVELARAAVREYECEAGVTRAVFHD